MNASVRLLTLAATLILAPFSRGEDQPKITANETGKLKARVGQQTTVTGKVSKANTSSSGMHFLNFEGGEFKAVTPPEAVAAFPEGGPAVLYKGRSVEISGLVEVYRGAPQIKLLKPEQIRLLEAASPPPKPKPNENATPAYSGKLTSIGRNTWQSPLGLRYSGRDPEGLTRVEHVMRHAKDMPNRPGSHGVYEGNQETIFALIDEAWDKARKSNLRPSNEGGRSSYTVPMGRRVGFLGGMEGARRRNPALQRVFIVFETGTTNIVTAFPK